MRYDYLVILRRESERTTDLLSLLLCLLSIGSFSFTAVGPLFTQHPPPAQSWFLTSISVILLTGMIAYFIARKKNTPVRFRFLLLLAALGWLAMPVLPWLGAIFFILAFLEYQTKRPLEIGFHTDRVVINTLIRKRYDWSAFSNVVLRDGLLTLDFADNRLLQREVVDDGEEDDADEDEFNAYCRERLAGVGKNP